MLHVTEYMLQRTYTVTDIFNKATNWYFNLNTLQQLVVAVGVGVVLAELAPKTNYINYIQPIAKPLPRKDFTDTTKRDTIIKQGFVCNSCYQTPKHWDFHHRDGNHSNNSPGNCEGLCLDCHAEKHRKKSLF